MNVMQEILNHAQKFSKGEFPGIGAGHPIRFSEACSVNDRIWQGDMAITIANSIPKGYNKTDKPQAQLVPGNTTGARHCLDDVNNVEMYLPPLWNEESLMGPYLKIKRETTILHPTHGAVTIPAGFEVQITYQREYNTELQNEMRARD